MAGVSWCVFALALFLWQSAFDVGRIDIIGSQRYQPEAVVSSIGVKPGTKAGKTELDSACRRLMETGLFDGCNWKYVPAANNSIAVTFELKDSPATQQVRLTLPGVSEEELWKWMSANEPLVQPKMPQSDDAVRFYTAAISRFLKQEVASSIDMNLRTKETTLVFRPANLPAITSVKFDGVSAIANTALEAKLRPLAIGVPFTEYDVKQLLDANIRPMYEELGRLNVSFPSIKAQGGAVTIRVDEGRVFNLAQVKIAGSDRKPKFTPGEAANWRKITDALESSAKSLRNQGYLEAHYEVDRKLDEAAGTVDLEVEFVPGKQFTFGTLVLEGLNPAQEGAVRAVWTLKRGAPMNEAYIVEFIQAALGKLGNEFTGVASQMNPVAGNVVDVTIGFRRR